MVTYFEISLYYHNIFLFQLPRVTLEQNTAFVGIRTGGPVIDTTIQVLQYTIPMQSRLIDTFTGTQGPYYIYSDNNFLIIRAYSTDVSAQQASITIGYVTGITDLLFFHHVQLFFTINRIKHLP
jgi:hypothetical protein